MDAESLFLTGPKVDARYGISAMTRWRWERNPSLAFPSPITINGRKLWRLSDLEAWERLRAVAGAGHSMGRGASGTRRPIGEVDTRAKARRRDRSSAEGA